MLLQIFNHLKRNKVPWSGVEMERNIDNNHNQVDMEFDCGFNSSDFELGLTVYMNWISLQYLPRARLFVFDNIFVDMIRWRDSSMSNRADFLAGTLTFILLFFCLLSLSLGGFGNAILKVGSEGIAFVFDIPFTLNMVL